MNLKYCYNKEIRKTFTPPATFQELLGDITNVFETKLPKRFSVQYKDNDQDLITISSDVEYKSMLKFDAPNSLASLKIFIVPNNSPEEKEMSFEVIDSSQLSANAGISEISLSQDPSEHASSRENSPSPKQKKGANSFNCFDTSSNCDMKDQKIQVSNVEPYMNQTFSQLYEAEALILQGLQAEPAEKNDCDQVNHDEEEEQEQEEQEEEQPNETLNQAMASEPSEPDSLYLYTEMQGNARNIENMIFSNEIEKVTQELAARNTPKMLEKLRSPNKQNNYQDSLLNQFLFPHDNFQNMQGTTQANNMSFDHQNQSTDAREMNITSRTQDKFYGNTSEPNDCNRYSRLLNHKRKLWSEELEEINRDYADDFYPNFTKYAEQSNSPKQREWTKFPTQRKIVNCDNYQKPKSPPRYLPPIVQPERQTRASEGYRYMSDLPREKPSYMQDNFYFDRQDRQEPTKMMENQGYEVTPGLSSRLFSIEDSEGMRVVYKTVFIKNTGTKPWTRCFVKPVGLIAGKTVELCNVGVGQTAVVALELRGYFGSRTYTSRWKLVHENQYGMVEVIGGPFDVEFTINSNSVANDRVRMNNMCEQSFEEDAVRFDYGRQDDVMQDGYKYEDFEDADGNRDEEDQEVDQTFARYFRPQEEEEMEDDYGDSSVHWFSYQDLRQVRDFTNNVHETSIDEYYLN